MGSGVYTSRPRIEIAKKGASKTAFQPRPFCDGIKGNKNSPKQMVK